jgi:hypothetical protein
VLDEVRQMNKTGQEVRAWQPPAKKNTRNGPKTQRKKEE